MDQVEAQQDLAVLAKVSKPERQDKKPKGKPAVATDTKGTADTKGISQLPFVVLIRLHLHYPGLTVSRSEDLAQWYSELLTKAGIVSYYDVQDMFPLTPHALPMLTLSESCYILEPPLIFAWEEIRTCVLMFSYIN